MSRSMQPTADATCEPFVSHVYRTRHGVTPYAVPAVHEAPLLWREGELPVRKLHPPGLLDLN